MVRTVDFEVGKIMRQILKLTHSLKVAKDEQCQQALQLTREECKFIFVTMLRDIDALRVMAGEESILPPHLEQ
jgi:hypothetical protein